MKGCITMVNWTISSNFLFQNIKKLVKAAYFSYKNEGKCSKYWILAHL